MRKNIVTKSLELEHLRTLLAEASTK
ncbi:hypothetical protein LCGC14_2599930, partial [marine sediment metagenome]